MVKLSSNFILAMLMQYIGVPLVMQNDKGWEMYAIANAHTNIHHALDQSLRETLQHRWCGSKMNVKPEAFWSLLRRQFSPGFETLFDHGLNGNLYDPDDPIEKYFIFLCSHLQSNS
jgi:hypothetical protein